MTMKTDAGKTLLCCGATRDALMGHQYRGTSQDYDGVSEWVCQVCGQRRGRWSGLVLKPGEIERQFGGAPVREEA